MVISRRLRDPAAVRAPHPDIWRLWLPDPDSGKWTRGLVFWTAALVVLAGREGCFFVGPVGTGLVGANRTIEGDKRGRKNFWKFRRSPVSAWLEYKPRDPLIMISKGIMDTSLERIRAKIAELETKLADLRITERELQALEKTSGAEDTNCAGTKPGGGAPNHRRRDCRHPRPAWRPFVSRDRRSYQGDRPRHQQS